MRLLGYLIAAFSGVLPYTKLVSMILCWLSPARLMPVSWRGCILLTLDQIGKFSMVDIFVTQMISATLHTTLNVGNGANTQADPLTVGLRTNQEAGFTCFVLATVGSLMLGHVCLHYHEHDPLALSSRSDPGTELLLPTNVVKSQCSVSDIDAALHGSRRRYVAPVLALNLLLATCGCALPAFAITLSSPISGGIFSEQSFSIFSFAAKLPDLSEAPNSFGARFGQFTFVFFVIVFINLHLLMMLFVWICKVPSRRLAMIHTAAHALFAWSALDVALISMVITLMEMRVSDFVWLSIPQEHFVAKLTGKPHVSRHGLRVGISLDVGMWVLVLTATLHAFIGRFSMVLLERAASAMSKWQDESSSSSSSRPNDVGVGSMAKGFVDRLAGSFTNGFIDMPKQL